MVRALHGRLGRVDEDVRMQPVVLVQYIRVILDDAQHQVVLAGKIGREVRDVHEPAGEEEPQANRIGHDLLWSRKQVGCDRGRCGVWPREASRRVKSPTLAPEAQCIVRWNGPLHAGYYCVEATFPAADDFVEDCTEWLR